MSSSRRRPERRLSIAQGRDAREIQLPPSAGKCFLLTSPFIERGGRRADAPGTGPRLHHLRERHHASDEPDQSALSCARYSLLGIARLSAAFPPSLVRATHRSGRPAAGRAALCPTGSVTRAAEKGSPGAADRSPT